MSSPKIIVPKGLYKRLKHLSKTTNRSPEYHLTLALQAYLLDAEEDKEDLRVASKYFKKVKKGFKVKTAPFNSLFNED